MTERTSPAIPKAKAPFPTTASQATNGNTAAAVQSTEAALYPIPHRYLWGIGYSAASVDCTAAAVFPFVAWLAVVGNGAFAFGMAGLVLSVTMLMIAVTVLVGLGRQSMLDFLRRSTGIVKATGAWMMMFAGIGLLVYLTQPETVAGLL